VQQLVLTLLAVWVIGQTSTEPTTIFPAQKGDLSITANPLIEESWPLCSGLNGGCQALAVVIFT
jgi:hypothetical protein